MHRHPCSSGIRTHDPSVRASKDISCLRPRGCCDRQYQQHISCISVEIMNRKRSLTLLIRIVWQTSYMKKVIITHISPNPPNHALQLSAFSIFILGIQTWMGVVITRFSFGNVFWYIPLKLSRILSSKTPQPSPPYHIKIYIEFMLELSTSTLPCCNASSQG
jgi:hypothetical protein